MRYINCKIILILIFSILIGCSSGSNNPTTPDNDIGAHVLLGIWNISFDLDKMEASVERNKTLLPEKWIKIWLSDPSVTINSYNSENRIIDIDIEISNSSSMEAYDPRIIVYADKEGRMLLNPDQWTRAFAYVSGWLVNPFKALAIDDPDRRFASKTEQNTNMKIYLPEGITDINIAFDASYPLHCPEPYKFENFRHTVINPQFKSSCFIEVEVLDWQDNVSSVYLRCPEITSYPYSTFQKVIGNTWGMYLINKNSVPPGNYNGILIGLSSDTSTAILADRVTIKVAADTVPPQWVTTVGITNVAAGDGEATVYWNMAVDPPNPPPIYYLLFMDTDNNPWDKTPILRFWHNPYTFTGLTNGITYYFGIRSMDSAEVPNIDQNNIVMSAVPKA